MSFIQETYEEDGEIHFVKNNLISQIFEKSGISLEEIFTGDFSDLEKQQFCELLGLPLAKLSEVSFYGPARAKEVHDHHLTVDGPGWVRVETPRPTTYAHSAMMRWLRYNPQTSGITPDALYQCFQAPMARLAAKQLAMLGLKIIQVQVVYND